MHWSYYHHQSASSSIFEKCCRCQSRSRFVFRSIDEIHVYNRGDDLPSISPSRFYQTVKDSARYAGYWPRVTRRDQKKLYCGSFLDCRRTSTVDRPERWQFRFRGQRLSITQYAPSAHQRASEFSIEKIRNSAPAVNEVSSCGCRFEERHKD